MRQVPQNSQLLLMGHGKLATHLAHYLNLLHIPFQSWVRAQQTHHELLHLLNKTDFPITHLLLAIRDDSLQKYVELAQQKPHIQFVHFSGALEINSMSSAHPLMTFGKALYNLETYEKIPFVVSQGLSLQDLLPGLKNPCFSIPAHQKSLYHALCVVAGNFPMFLWQEVFQQSQKTLGLPSSLFEPYLQQCLSNSLKGDQVSGPLARGDQQTIKKNLEALENSPLHPIYQTFCQNFSSHFNKETPL